MTRVLALGAAALLLAGCLASPATDPDGEPTGDRPGPAATSEPATGTEGFVVHPVATLDQPWAMTFLPDGRALVTQRGGELLLIDPGTGRSTPVGGVPPVHAAGQGGLGDVVLGPDHDRDGTVYLSWVQARDRTSGAVVGRARLVTGDQPRLEDLQVVWSQDPRTTGNGHFAHRLAFSPDGRYLFVSSGDRQKMTPAQDLDNTLGTIVRLTPDGAPAPGNPFETRGGATAQIWSYGHRNPLGLAFDTEGNLWSSEMGPRGGDEVNLIEAGGNYGWPAASNGSHYDGRGIPDHAPGDGFTAPQVWWTPSISPGSLMIYSGDAFPQWRGDAFVGALSGQALVRVDLTGSTATLAEQWDMGARIREVEQGPDGAIWLLEDGTGGRLLTLTPP